MNDADAGNVETYYKYFYSKMVGFNSTGLMKLLWKYPHKLMEKPYKGQHFDKILELGAGSGEHLDATSPKCAYYFATDIDLNRLQVIPSSIDFEVIKSLQNAGNLTFGDEEFSRLIATCLLAHLENPEVCLNEWRRVVKPGGFITIYLPCEPGLSLRLFRKFVSNRKANKLGFPGFSLYIARDHVNSAQNMIELINHVFREDRIRMKFRPFPLKSWYLNLFIVVQITKA